MKERHFYFPINRKETVNNGGSSHSYYNIELRTNEPQRVASLAKPKYYQGGGGGWGFSDDFKKITLT